MILGHVNPIIGKPLGMLKALCANLLTTKNTTMSDLTMILLALGMVAVFMGPFFVISAIKDKREAKQKEEEENK